MKKIWEKIKKIKHWEIYAAVIVVVIMLVIYLSSLSGNKSSKQSPTETIVTNDNGSYAGQLETKLEKVLGSIAGAGNVAVMVMTDGEGTAELAYDVQEKSVKQAGINGQETVTTTVEKTVVMKNGSPVILWTNPPKIIGIVVVATGANDAGVRLNLLHAVQTIIGDKNTPIQIISGI